MSLSPSSKLQNGLYKPKSDPKIETKPVTNPVISSALLTSPAFCDYFKIRVSDFFDTDQTYPTKYKSLVADLNKLTPDELGEIAAVVKRLANKKGK